MSSRFHGMLYLVSNWVLPRALTQHLTLCIKKEFVCECVLCRHVCVHVCLLACVRVCVCVRVSHMCLRGCVSVCLRAYVTRVLACLRVCVHACACMCACVCVSAHHVVSGQQLLQELGLLVHDGLDDELVVFGQVKHRAAGPRVGQLDQGLVAQRVLHARTHTHTHKCTPTHMHPGTSTQTQKRQSGLKASTDVVIS